MLCKWAISNTRYAPSSFFSVAEHSLRCIWIAVCCSVEKKTFNFFPLFSATCAQITSAQACRGFLVRSNNFYFCFCAERNSISGNAHFCFALHPIPLVRATVSGPLTQFNSFTISDTGQKKWNKNLVWPLVSLDARSICDWTRIKSFQFDGKRAEINISTKPNEQ